MLHCFCQCYANVKSFGGYNEFVTSKEKLLAQKIQFSAVEIVLDSCVQQASWLICLPRILKNVSFVIESYSVSGHFS